MERLTNDKFLGSQDSSKLPSYAGIYERLKQYEDLEITPEQVREISRLYKEKCEKVARLEKEIEKLKNSEDGCTSCMFNDERTEDDYPCSECSRPYDDKYLKKTEG